MTELFGQQDASTAASDFNTLRFIIEQRLMRIVTCALVKVVAVTNNGGITPVGMVDVQPLVNQLTGDGTAVPHATIYRLPYMRLQGGANAVILDPQVGDIGMAGFCYRDISKVKATKAQANPGSSRTFNWSDGLYFGGFLNGTPTQYVAFAEAGITVVSPNKITLQAPIVEIDASSELHVVSPDSEFSGTIHTPGTITGDTDVVGSGTSLHTHTHSGVQSGGSNTGPPV